MSAITAKEMADYLWATLNKVVEEHYPEDEREEAKARILNSFSASMFCKPMKEDGDETRSC